MPRTSALREHTARAPGEQVAARREEKKFMSYQRLLTGIALALVACGGAPLNQAKLAEAQTSMHAAETLGAENDPRAKQSLEQARQQIAAAKRLAADGDGEEANLRLDRALADVDLASQLTRSRTEAEKAREAWAKVKAMDGVTGAPQ